MPVFLDQIKDPKTRARVRQALDAAEGLQRDLSKICDEHKTNSQIQSSQPEQAVRHEPLEKGEGKEPCSPRITVSVKSCRNKLLDPDNLCPKSLIDGLRYAGLIPDDRPQDITLSVTQEKCCKQDERTEIEIEYL